MSEKSNIIIPDFGPTEDQIEFRKAIAHRVHPVVVDTFLSNAVELDDEIVQSAAKATLAFTDALIEALEE